MNTLLFVSLAILGAAIASEDAYDNCDPFCQNVHRYCEAPDFQHLVDCSDYEWQIRCNRTCKLCTQCPYKEIDIDQEETINNVNIQIDQIIEQTDISISNMQVQIDTEINNINNEINEITGTVVPPLFLAGQVVTSPVGTSGPLYNTNSRSTAEDTYYVTFDKPFLAAPQVIAAICLVDTYNTADNILEVEVEDITTVGFTVKFSAAGNSLHYQAGASWIAVGYDADLSSLVF